ncbi:unnamed protein product, partial [Tilletia caries]
CITNHIYLHSSFRSLCKHLERQGHPHVPELPHEEHLPPGLVAHILATFTWALALVIAGHEFSSWCWNAYKLGSDISKMCGKAQYENKCDSPVPLLKENCSLIKSCSTLQAPSLSWPLFRLLTAIAILIAFFYHFLSTTPTTPANAAPLTRSTCHRSPVRQRPSASAHCLNHVSCSADRHSISSQPSLSTLQQRQQDPALTPARLKEQVILRPVSSPLPGGGQDDGAGRIGPGIDHGGGRIQPEPNGSLALLLSLLTRLSSMLFFLLFVSFPTGRARSTSAGLDGIEGRWLEGVKEAAARGYARAKEWVTANPPASESTDITMSQSLAIQEKSISSWSFDPD